MKILSLLKETAIERVMNAVAAGQTTQTSDAVDMDQCKGCLFIVMLGACDATSVPSVKIQQSSDDGVSDGYSDLEGTSVVGDASSDNKMLVVDVPHPGKRYLKAVVTRATADVVIDGVIAIRYGARSVPVTQGSDVANSELHVSPAEGTA